MRRWPALGILAALTLGCSEPDCALSPPALEPGSELAGWQKALLHGDLAERRKAAEDAGLFGGEESEALPALLEAAGDPDPLVRRWAAEAIEDIADVEDPNVARCVRALARGQDPFVSAVSQRMLAPPTPAPSEGPEPRPSTASVGPGEENAEDALPGPLQRRSNAAGEEPVPARSPSRKESREAIRRAKEEIREAKKAGAAGLDRIIAYLDHEELQVQASAAGAIADLGPEGAAAVPVLVGRLEAQPEDRPAIFCNALAKIGPASEPAVPTLIGFVGAQDPHVDRGAIRALASIGPGAAAALPKLRARLQDRSADTRLDAAVAIVQIDGDASMLPILIDTFEQGGWQRRVQALQGIEHLGPAAAAAAPVLLAAHEKADSDLRSLLHRALVAIGSPAREHLELAAVDPDSRLSEFALGILVRIEQQALRDPTVQ